eukprot:10531556-Ditylum_brightwellii.AAC.1
MSPIHTKRMDLHPRNNPPWLMIRTKKTIEENAMGLQTAVDLAGEQNQNLASAQKELIHWHQRLCHVSISTIQWLARSWHLSVKNPDAVGNCQIPVCASCQFVKQKRRPHNTTMSQKNSEKEAELKSNNLFPVQQLSADHYQSAVPGRTYSSRGSYHPEDMFNGGTIFVNYASDKIFIYHQQSLSAANSIKSMLRLKREDAESDVTVSYTHLRAHETLRHL